MVYAPTWRLRFTQEQHIDMNVYDLDIQRLKKTLTNKFGGEWTMMIRFHPFLRLYAKGYQEAHPDVMNVTDYQDMQRLLMATDVIISDYSSCIFDAAMRRIPCFTYATDFDQYKYEERGVYYEMEELPFPYAKNNDELEQNVKAFDMEDSVLMVRAPQCFVLKDVMEAHQKALAEGKHDFVDTCSMMNHYGYELHTVIGTAENIKITTPADYFLFKAIIEAREESAVFGF